MVNLISIQAFMVSQIPTVFKTIINLRYVKQSPERFDCIRNILWTPAYSTPIGSNFSRVYKGSHLFAQLLFVNGSLLISSVTISNTSLLVGMIIYCNNEQRVINMHCKNRGVQLHLSGCTGTLFALGCIVTLIECCTVTLTLRNTL